VRASLADQGGCSVDSQLAIGLGANLPSAAGSPLETLVAVREPLRQLLREWAGADRPLHTPVLLHWSPLFCTAPVGGPPDQPDYLNAAVVVQVVGQPCTDRAQELLRALQQLELAFGRQRHEHWGPRTLDLDLLWWGELDCELPGLQLPHPRWHQRGFVLAPLLAIEQRCGYPLGVPQRFGPLSGLRPDSPDPLPEPLTGAPLGWLA